MNMKCPYEPETRIYLTGDRFAMKEALLCIKHVVLITGDHCCVVESEASNVMSPIYVSSLYTDSMMDIKQFCSFHVGVLVYDTFLI